MSFGNRLKKIRSDNNLTQEELANKIDTTRSNIANYENDRNMPSLEILERLSKLFNCSLDYLLGTSDIRNLENKLKEEFEKLYSEDIKGLTKEEISEALRLYKKIKYGKE